MGNSYVFHAPVVVTACMHACMHARGTVEESRYAASRGMH